MTMRIIFSYCLILFFLSPSCYSQKPVTNTDKINRNAERAITLSGFPSRDTAAITFYKNDGWMVSVKMRNPMIVKKPESCKSCHQVFTDAFFDYLFSIRTETVQANDCRITIDSVIDGKTVRGIQDFYMSSDLLTESITIKQDEKQATVSYHEPRTALKYCKNNIDRLAFIRVSDRLLKIK